VEFQKLLKPHEDYAVEPEPEEAAINALTMR
jgi:hypothetical protein